MKTWKTRAVESFGNCNYNTRNPEEETGKWDVKILSGLLFRRSQAVGREKERVGWMGGEGKEESKSDQISLQISDGSFLQQIMEHHATHCLPSENCSSEGGKCRNYDATHKLV